MKKSIGEKIGDVFIFIVMFFVVIITLWPLIYVLSMSVSDPEIIMMRDVWLLPKGFTLVTYSKILSHISIWRSYGNTVFIAVIGTLLNVAVTLMAGYVLSRKQFFFKKFAMIMLVITMFFNGGLIPTFLVIKSLGLFNTRWALILPVLTTTWNIIITRTYVQTNIPDGLIESAKIDGYNDIFIVFKIVLPLSAPIIAVIALFAAVGYWNDYFSALLYLPEITKQPISLFLRRILLQASATEVLEEMEGMEEAIFYANQIKYSVIIITILPILFVYPFLQKYFAKGIMVGSLKG